MTWNDGTNYKGEWLKGQQHGRGVMSFVDGRLKDGLWEAGVFKGRTVMADGTEIDEQMKRDPKLLKSFIQKTSEETKINKQFQLAVPEIP